MHRPPGGQGRNGATRAQSWTGVCVCVCVCGGGGGGGVDVVPPRLGTKIKKGWQIFRPKWVKIKIFVVILFYE